MVHAILRLGAVVCGLTLLSSLEGLAQGSIGVTVPANAVFTGSWTYRSYVSNPDPAVEPNDILFGLAEIVLEEASDGTLTGTLGGDWGSLVLTGNAVYSATSASAKFQGVGTINGQPWVYDYFGYASPLWSNATDQVPAFVGTVVRTIPHGGAPAGFSGQFIAVKQAQP